MKIGLGVAGGIILVIILIVVLISVVFTSASHNIQKERNAHAITRAQFDSLQLGQPKDVVLRGLPQPQDSQQFSSDYGTDLPNLNQSCVYFNERTTGDNLASGSYFQLCFDQNNILRSKNAY